MIKGLYIHIPFCKQICLYCDFCKMVAPASLQEQYMNALTKELHSQKDKYKDLATVYIGGGTPSSLNLSLLERFLIELGTVINPSRIEEFTIEANVADIDEEFLTLIKSYGINRISIGVQTTNDSLLKLLKRDHQKADIFKVHKLLEKHGIDNYNFDFIHSIPNQTEKDLLQDLDIIQELKPPHISYYSLIIEERTELKYLIEKKVLSPCDEDTDYQYSNLVRNRLRSMGYQKYETSNYCLPGYESKHNLLYWNLEEYIGIGLNAASQYNDSRKKNVNRISEYIKQAQTLEFKPLEEAFEPIKEYLILGLRKQNGISVADFHKRFQIDLFELFPTLLGHVENGLLQRKQDRLYFTDKGQDLANQVFIDII